MFPCKRSTEVVEVAGLVVVVDPAVVVVITVVVVVASTPFRDATVVVTALRATVVVEPRPCGLRVTVVTTDTVVVELTTVVVLSAVCTGAATTITGARGVTASMFDSAPKPIAFTARILTSYCTPLVRFEILSGDVIDPIGHGLHVTPLSSEYSWFVSADPPLLPNVNEAEIAPSLAVSESRIGANGTTAEITNDCVTSVAAVKFEVDPEEATSVQVPELTIVTERPLTVHTFVV